MKTCQCSSNFWVGVTIQMNCLWQFFRMVPFVLQDLAKWCWEFLLNFYFGQYWEWKAEYKFLYLSYLISSLLIGRPRTNCQQFYIFIKVIPLARVQYASPIQWTLAGSSLNHPSSPPPRKQRTIHFSQNCVISCASYSSILIKFDLTMALRFQVATF